MTKRQTLLVGSLPFSNEREAMTEALNELSNSLFSLPDGEVGEKETPTSASSRSAWIIHVLQSCAKDTENWEIVKKGEVGEDGMPVNYINITKLRPKYSPKQIVDHLDFHYLKFFQESYPIFQELRKGKQIDDLKFQVGIPTGLDLAALILKPMQMFRYTKPFNQRLAYEVNEMHKQAGEDLQLQIEIPMEVGLNELLPTPLRSFVMKSLFQLIKQINPAIPIGVHLCFGDFHNKVFTQPKTLKKIVSLTNYMIRKWPKTHQLTYIHFPLTEGENPPFLESNYYKPLKQLQLPNETRFIAGFVHEKRNKEELQQILQIVDAQIEKPVDIACSCGLGQRDKETATLLMRRMKQLADM